MNINTIPTATDQKARNSNVTAHEEERKRQIEETRRWISVHALKKLRQAWRR
jgi:hypothetical protein